MEANCISLVIRTLEPLPQELPVSQVHCDLAKVGRRISWACVCSKAAKLSPSVESARSCLHRQSGELPLRHPPRQVWPSQEGCLLTTIWDGDPRLVVQYPELSFPSTCRFPCRPVRWIPLGCSGYKHRTWCSFVNQKLRWTFKFIWEFRPLNVLVPSQIVCSMFLSCTPIELSDNLRLQQSDLFQWSC